MAYKTIYIPIIEVPITEKRSLIISSCNKGGYTIAQKVYTEIDGKSAGIFLKGSIHAFDLDALKKIRDTINSAIAMVEEGVAPDDTDWDDM